MTSNPTDRLANALAGRYRIERHLGEGGMATVYLAEDTKHERKVAVKVLRPELAAVLGAERFVQEIKTTAGLQHPHILPLHDSGEADGFLYYVMPFIDGETLRDKLNRETQLGVEEAVRVATEIADALDYAHRQNVIHRDIKPENILLHDGRPMVADFGIALAVSAAAGGRMTETGLSLGTPHYMSPEQATADRDLTNRSDIYSLGTMLYEMLTGEPPHLGNSAQQIIMKIVTDTARPVTELRKSVPPNVTAAVARALEKLPADRFESAADFAAALGNAAFTVPGTPGPRVAAAPSTGPWNRVSVGMTALAAVLSLMLAAVWLRPVAPRTPTYFDIALPTGYRLAAGQTRPFALSPDGRRVVFAGQPEVGAAQLFLRDRGEPDARVLPGTENARDPFFSPDGEWVGFLLGTEMMKIAVGGGQPQSISDSLGLPLGVARWGSNDSILIPLATGIFSIPSVGGSAVRVPGFDGLSYGRPMWSEDHERIVATIWQGDLIVPTVTERASGAVQVVDELREHLVVEYLPDGRLVVGRGGLLTAIPFDLRTGQLEGSPQVVVDGVQRSRTDGGAWWAAVTPNTLAYVEATPATPVWVDRRGRVEQIVDEDFPLARRPKLSPDETRFVYEEEVERGGTLLAWYDMERRTSTRIVTEGFPGDPIWTADGSAVTFLELLRPETRLVVVPVTGEPRRDVIMRSPVDFLPSPHSWSADGRYLALFVVTTSGRDIHVLERGGDSREFVVTEFNERSPSFSPDGAWIAYSSDRSGRTEVWLTSFPDREVTRQVSTGGGRVPQWSNDGSEIFYRWGDAVYAVSMRTRPTVEIGVPELLFRGPYLSELEVSGSQDYDVASDGRFLMIRQEPARSIRVVLDWDRR